ncbi:MAG: cytochrome c3 family protein [Nitrospirae bacterium]|nr:cytochrome c3 family protein [Nitrospirota bacterium]
MKKRVLIVIAVIVILMVSAIVGSEYYTARPKFCGTTCHIMKKPYDSWKGSKHKDTACVDCHYAPGEKFTPQAKFKGLGQVFTYLAFEEREVRKPTLVSDQSCMTSKCHPQTGTGKESEYWTKKLTYVEYERADKSTGSVPFIHKTHSEKTIEGQKLHCQTCHSHASVDKHFEVSKETCFLCHFRNTKFAEGRAKCSICHEVPTKPFKQDARPEEKPVTHQVLEQRKVSCASCHLELIKGKGEVKPVRCLDCHDDLEMLKDIKDKKKMHESHIAAQNAKCLDCHDSDMQHKKAPHFDAAIQDCAGCHSEPHLYQKMLIAGEGGKGIDRPFPIKHYDMKTSCFACHAKEGHDSKGRKAMRADVKRCGECHTKEDEKSAEAWKAAVETELRAARDAEKKAIAAIEGAKGKAPDKAVKKAMGMLRDGQENLKIVDAGGGVHNKKYSMLLIETAVESFENAITELGVKK